MPKVASVIPANGTAHAQNPNSDLSLPFAEMQREPLTMGGKTRIT